MYNDEKYINDFHGLELNAGFEPNIRDNENGILFLVEFYILKYIKLNPMLVLGGLLMPINITLGLVVGGLFALIPQEREDWYPFWSGVFASNSIWMFIRAML